jgi:hypothetical protein
VGGHQVWEIKLKESLFFITAATRRTMMLRILALLGMVIAYFFPGGELIAQDRGYIVQPPGKPPTSVKPATTDDGFVIQIPERPPLYAKPKSVGCYTIDVPGQPPKTMTRRPNGGFVIENPGRTPTYIDPRR